MMRLDKRFLKCTLIPGALLAITMYVYIGYFCSEKTCGKSPKVSDVAHGHSGQSNTEASGANENKRVLTGFSRSSSYTYREQKLNNSNSEELSDGQSFEGSPQAFTEKFPIEVLEKHFPFSMENGDQVLVFIHMQKTGGTVFGKHLVKDIVNSRCKPVPGAKVRDCMNSRGNIWLFSRHSVGWACGLHADWTVMTGCVNKAVGDIEKKERTRRFLFISILRDPMLRYLSEWRHVQRGATWGAEKLICDGREATVEEVPFCYNSTDWSDVSLKEFYSCKSNLAINRQVRMLADLSKVGCYNKTAQSEAARNRLMLESAISNLKDLAYFGLTEYQRESQILFERTFPGLKFSPDFEQYDRTKADRAFDGLSDNDLNHIRESNAMDIELYKYAKELFFQRLKQAQQAETFNL